MKLNPFQIYETMSHLKERKKNNPSTEYRSCDVIIVFVLNFSNFSSFSERASKRMSKCRKPIEHVKYWPRYDHLNKYISHRNSVLYALAPNH